VAANQLYVGRGNTANDNIIIIQDNDSLLQVTNNFFVGYHGSGNALEATQGAHLKTGNAFIGHQNDSEDNSVLLSGATWEAQDLTVGRSGRNNTMELHDGALMISANTYLGYNSDANTIWIDGQGSCWTNYATFFVGYRSAGTGNVVRISNGGSLLAAALAVRGGNQLKMNNGASISISGGSSATLHGGGQMLIGESQGANNLSIANGGRVESGNATLGLLATANANSVSITDAGSQWNAAQFVVGESGGGNTLNISNGGQLNAETLNIGNQTSSGNNRVTVSGANAQINLSGALDIGAGEAVANRLELLLDGRLSSQTARVRNNATLHLGNGVLFTTDSTQIDSGATLSGWGQISGSVTNMGVINIGDASHFETLSFADSLFLAGSSEIIFDLAAINAYDRVVCQQEIDFDGKLTIHLANGFSPQLNDVFDLFNWSSGSPSTFSSFALPAFSQGSTLSWDTSDLSTDGTIKVVPEPMAISLILLAALLLAIPYRIFKAGRLGFL
jgi:T5SS/PEP-CTERM-associated repeat protein